MVGRYKTKKFSFSGGFHMYDKDGKHLGEIQGKMFKAEYKFVTPDKKTEMGSVSRTWAGMAKSLFTGADTYGVTISPQFAKDSTAKMLILGATIAVESIFKKKKEAKSAAASSAGGVTSDVKKKGRGPIDIPMSIGPRPLFRPRVLVVLERDRFAVDLGEGVHGGLLLGFLLVAAPGGG